MGIPMEGSLIWTISTLAELEGKKIQQCRIGGLDLFFSSDSNACIVLASPKL